MIVAGSPAQLGPAQAAAAQLTKVEQDDAPGQPLSDPLALIS